MKLAGRVAIITGGGRGIGKAGALEFVREGATVVISDIAEHDEVKETLSQIEGMGGKGIFVQTDVGDENQVISLVDHTVETYGKVDILVNCAGINRLKNALDFTEKEVVDIIHTNLMGVFWCCQAVGRKMVERRRGKVITISSMLSEIAWFQRAPYAASKGGVRQLIRVLSIEWGPYGITVNAIAPGSIKTPMFEKACERDPEFLKKITDLIPMGKPGLPEDHRGALLLLCSKAGDYITGQTLMVDGGLSVDGAHTLRLADQAG